MAVYAMAGLENTTTGDFIPYVMGVARDVLAGPGEEVVGVDILMNIPLDHALDVRLEGLPMRVRAGPDRFRVTAVIDLGGEGIIERMQRRVGADGRSVFFEPIDVVRQGSIERVFRFTAQPALYGALSDGRYSIEAGWYTRDFEDVPWTERDVHGVVDVAGPVVVDGFLGIPVAAAPVYGAHLPEDRIIRWTADGPEPDYHQVLIFGGDGNPAWRHFTPGNVREAPIPDLSTIPEISDISPGVITWAVFAVKIPGFVYDEFSYTYLYDAYWSHSSLDLFTAFQ
jgi:hypothetical protein